jgi:hypothetical protein
MAHPASSLAQLGSLTVIPTRPYCTHLDHTGRALGPTLTCLDQLERSERNMQVCSLKPSQTVYAERDLDALEHRANQ